MTPGVKLAAVWTVLGLGLWVVCLHIPMPGVSRPQLGSELPSPPPALAPLPEGSADEQYGKGLIALAEGRLKDASASLDRAIALDPGNASAYVYKAFTLARTEGNDPAEIRRLLAKASQLGFDRTLALERQQKALAQGADKEAGRFALERAVLLGFGEPPDPEGARKALDAAKAAGMGFPAALPAQVSLAPGR